MGVKLDFGIKGIMEINQYDKKGFRHGPWEDYYPNGQLASKGEYKNGKKHGVWEEYYYSGGFYYVGEFKKGKSIGIWYEQRYD